MSDKQSAAILVAIATVAFVIWYRSRSLIQRAALFGATGPSPPDSSGDKKAASGVPVLPSVGGFMTPLQRLLDFARKWGLKVTSTTGGRHVPGSMHYQGRAIDVRTRGVSSEVIEDAIAAARNAGFRVLDERTDPGHGKWSGPHLHIEDGR